MSSGPNGNGGAPQPFDPAKQFPFYPPEWWMVTEQWTELIEESKVDPNSLGRTFTKTRTFTRAIAVHPLAHHTAGMAHGLANYAIINSVPITKKLYDWWVDVTTPPAAKKAEETKAKVIDIADRITRENEEDASKKLS